MVDPYFNGQFDEFRIYNGVLSDAAVAASFAGGPNVLLAPVPSLNVALSGASVVLSWPLNVPGFTLESTTVLQPATSGHR